MPADFFERADLERLARAVGTPFFAYDAAALRERIAAVRRLAGDSGITVRYAMKACSVRRVLEEIRSAGLWIDAVSGNEVLRARRAGFPGGFEPPVILYTADVFRDGALEVLLRERVLLNAGSPGMVEEAAARGYRGPAGLRVNPGFGHGHVRECDTGGPSSKHGIWFEDVPEVARRAGALGLRVTLLHAHVGSGPEPEQLYANLRRLGEVFAELVGHFPDLAAVNLGGGLPHPYRPGAAGLDLARFGAILAEVRARLCAAAGRPVRVEIEPGRYLVAPAGWLVTRVTDVKRTRGNQEEPGHTFVMVDAGFVDLVRPAMYGAYHHITVLGAQGRPEEPVVVAGPLCESGDVFTRDAAEVVDPRVLPLPRRGDLLVLHDAGAYGAVMASNYNSIGRAPQIWVDGDEAYVIARRETVEDLTRTECFERL